MVVATVVCCSWHCTCTQCLLFLHCTCACTRTCTTVPAVLVHYNALSKKLCSATGTNPQFAQQHCCTGAFFKTRLHQVAPQLAQTPSALQH